MGKLSETAYAEHEHALKRFVEIVKNIDSAHYEVLQECTKQECCKNCTIYAICQVICNYYTISRALEKQSTILTEEIMEEDIND